MRVIGGEWKGRVFKVDKNFAGRPTTDYAKEALFNVLNNYMEWDEVEEAWDLFSGTGALSLELASRGVKRVISVEGNMRNARSLQKLRTEFGAPQLQVVASDVKAFVSKQVKLPKVILADPPYDLPWLTELPGLLFEKDASGLEIMVIEHPKEINFEGTPHFWQRRSYGHVHFSFFKTEQA